MSGFPLYDKLITELPKKDMTVKEKEDFIKNIKIMNTTGHELVYALIHVYHTQACKDDGEKIEKLPYKGEQEGCNEGCNTFGWVFTKFPIKLRHLLSSFAIMHIIKQKEEKDRITINT